MVRCSSKLLGILGVALAACAPFSAEPPTLDSPAPPPTSAPPAADDPAVGDGKPSQPSNTTPTSAECTEAGAKTFGGHCYFKVGSMTSYEATAACATRGAHLVTINSADEQVFAKTFSPSAHMWIGLMALTPSRDEEDFGWVTGEPVKLDVWAKDQPNGDGICVAFDDEGKWIDHSCTTSYVALCERE